MDDLDAALQAERDARKSKGDALSATVPTMDLSLYGTGDVEYTNELVDELEAESSSSASARMSSLAQRVIASHGLEEEGDGNEALKRFQASGSSVNTAKIIDREDNYKRAHRQNLTLSPERGGDAFTGAEPARGYGEILAAQQLAREKDALLKKLQKQETDAALIARATAQALTAGGSSSAGSSGGDTVAPLAPQQGTRRRRMWDDPGTSSSSSTGAGKLSGATTQQWDATPILGGASGGLGDETPLISSASRWDETPVVSSGGLGGSDATAPPAAAARPKRSRWEETPVVVPSFVAAAAAASAKAASLSGFNSTPLIAHGGSMLTGEAQQQGSSSLLLTSADARREREIALRNTPLSDEALDALLPSSGYRILEPPSNYAPIRDPSKKLMSTPTPQATPGFVMSETPSRESYGVPLEAPGGQDHESQPAGVPGLPYIKPEDVPFFGALIGEAGKRGEDELTPEESKQRLVSSLLLKIKNGTPPQRKVAMRSITDKAREIGAGSIFQCVLPLLMSPTLEDTERHVLVKVVERVLYSLDELVRPYVHKILVVVEPMLIDDDYYARVEGRELIANLSKAAGLATMITVMRPDIDSPNEFHRNTTARAFSVVAGALGVSSLLPFIRAVTASKKSWQARHTGCKIVQQTALLVGSAVLPHLGGLVDAVKVCLEDKEESKVSIMSALALAALAEAAAPYGIEAFDSVLRPLMLGVKKLRSKAFAAHIKAVGMIIPLMDAGPASMFTKEIMPSLIREFATPDDDMRKIVLKVLAQCASCLGVEASYLRDSVLGDFFTHFWTRRVALDKRSAKAVVETTLALAQRVGAGELVLKISPLLKDEAQPLRKMSLEALDKILGSLGASSLSTRLEEEVMDGVLFAYQEIGVGGGEEESSFQSSETFVVLSAFGVLLNALGTRSKPYLPQIAGVIKWRLNNKSPALRMLAADLVGKVAPALRGCGDDALLAHLGVTLYECLGEEYPEVLGSLLGGLRDVVAVIGIPHMQPPIKDLLPRLTPILKNRSEKVQEACIDLVGRIADRGADKVAPKEWMRICFELLELLRAPRKAIRRAAVNTFGFIAKAVSPQDVLHTLLNNLKVHERTNRVCTTVAIGIIAEACAPFTVLPALMNEYRTPDMNVQNGVLKALSFMLEYIGETARDYVYAITPLLSDALQDRDAVHRQTACACVKHLALGVAGGGVEDALIHLLNYVWPNIFETSPHVIGAVFEAIEALRVALGPAHIMAYLRAGLFHPARRIREVYWRLYNNLVVYCGHSLPAHMFTLPNPGDGAATNYNRGILELCL